MTYAEQLLWPTFVEPSDLARVEEIPLADRGLPASTFELLQRAAKNWPERDALVVLPDSGRWQQPVRRTYAQLCADVSALAQLLYDCGVHRTDAVALMSPNCDELITATLAAQVAGVAAPINSALSRTHIGELLRRSGAQVLIAAGPELSDVTWNTARDLAQAGDVTVLLALRPTGATGEPAPLEAVDGVHTAYLSGSVESGRPFAGETPRADDVAALFHTGGTTGDPKLAAHTHANEVANAWMIALNSTLDDTSTLFAALPLFHVNALMVTLLAPMARGQRVVWAGPLGYREPALYAEFWKIVQNFEVAAMSAVPTVYSVLAQCPIDADISSLRSCIVGASPLPAAVRASFESHTGVTLLQGYGLTEATCASARSFPDLPRHESVGQRFPYQSIKAVRKEGDRWIDVPAGDIGTIVIGGPTVFVGYVLGRLGDQFVLDGLGKLVDGWLDTGDLGRVGPDGFVQLTGRAKDLIIRGGHNIDPAVVEDALLAHPEVTGASAVGSPDPHSGEVPVAYVTVTGAVTGADLADWVKSRVVESAAAPRKVTVLDVLPVTDVGNSYKVPLRADATREAVVGALIDVVDNTRIRTEIDNGSIVVVIETDDRSAVDAALGSYPITWRTEGTT